MVKENMGSLLPIVYNFLTLYKACKYISWASMIVFTIISTIETSLYIKYLSLETFSKHTIVQILCYYVVVSNLLYCTTSNTFFNRTVESYGSWFSQCTQSIPEKARNSISQYSKKTSSIWLACLVTAFFALLLHVYHFYKYTNLYLTSNFLEKLLPLVCYKVCKLGASLLIFVQIVPGISIPSQVIFHLFYGKVQVILLTEDIRSKNEIRRNIQIDSQIIKLVVEKYSEIAKFQLEIMNSNRTEILLYIFTCMMLCFGSLVSVLLSDAAPTFAFVEIGNVLVCSFFICYVSQDYINSGEVLIETFWNMDWYNWNVKDQKLYLTALGLILNGLEVRIFSMFVVGSDLMKRLYRTVYGVGGFLYSVRNKE